MMWGAPLGSRVSSIRPVVAVFCTIVALELATSACTAVLAPSPPACFSAGDDVVWVVVREVVVWVVVWDGRTAEGGTYRCSCGPSRKCTGGGDWVSAHTDTEGAVARVVAGGGDDRAGVELSAAARAGWPPAVLSTTTSVSRDMPAADTAASPMRMAGSAWRPPNAAVLAVRLRVPLLEPPAWPARLRLRLRLRLGLTDCRAALAPLGARERAALAPLVPLAAVVAALRALAALVRRASVGLPLSLSPRP